MMKFPFNLATHVINITLIFLHTDIVSRKCLPICILQWNFTIMDMQTPSTSQKKLLQALYLNIPVGNEILCCDSIQLRQCSKKIKTNVIIALTANITNTYVSTNKLGVQNWLSPKRFGLTARSHKLAMCILQLYNCYFTQFKRMLFFFWIKTRYVTLELNGHSFYFT